MGGFFPGVPQLAERVRTALRPAKRQRAAHCHLFRYERVLGTSLELRVYAEASKAAHAAETAVSDQAEIPESPGAVLKEGDGT
jgi:hypothetical protein